MNLRNKTETQVNLDNLAEQIGQIKSKLERHKVKDFSRVKENISKIPKLYGKEMRAVGIEELALQHGLLMGGWQAGQANDRKSPAQKHKKKAQSIDIQKADFVQKKFDKIQSTIREHEITDEDLNSKLGTKTMAMEALTSRIGEAGLQEARRNTDLQLQPAARTERAEHQAAQGKIININVNTLDSKRTTQQAGDKLQ